MKEGKLSESLKVFLEKGADWERKLTSLPGVFLVKMPPFGKLPTRLVVEINPVDASGNPTKRRGYTLRNSAELKSFRDILADDKLGSLLAGVDEVNPKSPERPRPEQGKEVIEI